MTDLQDTLVWNAIHHYVRACGGNPMMPVLDRMKDMVALKTALWDYRMDLSRKLVAAENLIDDLITAAGANYPGPFDGMDDMVDIIHTSIVLAAVVRGYPQSEIEGCITRDLIHGLLLPYGLRMRALEKWRTTAGYKNHDEMVRALEHRTVQHAMEDARHNEGELYEHNEFVRKLGMTLGLPVDITPMDELKDQILAEVQKYKDFR